MGFLKKDERRKMSRIPSLILVSPQLGQHFRDKEAIRGTVPPFTPNIKWLEWCPVEVQLFDAPTTRFGAMSSWETPRHSRCTVVCSISETEVIGSRQPRLALQSQNLYWSNRGAVGCLCCKSTGYTAPFFIGELFSHRLVLARTRMLT